MRRAAAAFVCVVCVLCGPSSVLLGCTESDAPPQQASSPPPDEQETIRRFREVFAARRPVFRNRFLGISTLQNPMDAWIVQELISETKPDLIIEAGTYHGGSALLWAMFQREVVPDGRVVTIDVEDVRDAAAVEHPLARERVDFLLGSSTAPEIVAEVRRRAEGKRVLVLLDSLHTADHVYGELRAYADLVPVGGYVVVQDTLVGPIGGIDRFLAERPDFVADRERERFLVTNTVKGYLKRVR
jgi:cephalosporin hydroxylase